LKVRLTLLAAAEIDAAAAYLLAESPRAAAAVRSAIEAAIDSLADLPARGRQGKLQGTRELVVRRSAYLAVYSVEADEVIVLRVRHSSQSPLT